MLRLARNKSRGFTIIELIVSMSILAILLFGLSMIYFSSYRVYLRTAWKLPPFDAATLATESMTRELRGAMLIDSFGSNWLVAVMPRKDNNRDNIIYADPNGGSLSLVIGDEIRFYMSNSTGSLDADGNCLWMAVKPYGQSMFTPKKKLADNIHPELNPTDPNTGQPKPMFTYYPDETRLYGVEMLITATSRVYGHEQTQSADTEVYLRNL
jgi:prepilin-type N-terminal cleavage/methylation domain-containing protein